MMNRPIVIRTRCSEMVGHRAYLEPARVASVRCVEWIRPARKGHKQFLDVKRQASTPSKEQSR
jgi:hypothetical protein